jgi:hypothetical protein
MSRQAGKNALHETLPTTQGLSAAVAPKHQPDTDSAANLSWPPVILNV